jgi:SAM-dependent methyltransferase
VTAPLPIAPDPAREEAELAAYLGDAYDRTRLERWAQALDDEAELVGDEATLYRTSEAYLYNLTAFAMTGTKVPYLAALAAAVAPGARLLDYGCGIGSDGLTLLEAGYQVAFADFDNPSTRYLRWRLERRRLDAPVHDLDRDPPPPGFDLAYAFDVIEHVDDPWTFLAAMEERASLVLVNLLEEDEADTELHRELPIPAILRHAAGRGVVRYARFHGGRSHLVLYRSRPAGPLARLAGRWRLARGGGGRSR